MALFSPIVYTLPLAIAIVTIFEAFLGSSAGKVVCRLRIASEMGAPATKRQLLGRFLIKRGVWVGLTGALIIGSWQIAVASLALAVVASLGKLLALRPNRQTLHDSLSKTTIIEL